MSAPITHATRALLLTDVVDSTKLSEALGDTRMAELWAAHDRVARDLLLLHDGREIDKTDGFLLLFEDAAKAVDYALAYHRAIGRLDPPIQARAGLHVGSVVLTETPAADVARGAKPLEVDGVAKPTAARVMSVARGGQLLLTEAAREAVGDTAHRVVSHGHWRMKGVAEPLELFEIGAEGAPFEPPPDGAKVYRVAEKDGLWLPVGEIPTSLPGERDPFVGRSADLRALADALEANRLVSVLGPGGTGKTRLSVRFGWTWIGDHPGGVWFCDLSESRDLDGMLGAVARALDSAVAPRDPVDALGNAIAAKGHTLVILDNVEQIADLAVDPIGRWVEAAPEARFVVTTREVLGLPGEGVLALSPLPEREGVELFVRRAAASKRGYAPDAAERATIAELIRLLDALPLAIELAASRIRALPVHKILARMNERFRLLASARGRADRQATLRATLDWSWELLDPAERSALAQLSAFEGGFTLEAAEEVIDLDGFEDAPWTLDLVQALADKSLVRVVSDDRYDLLVSIQAYAAEKLRESDAFPASGPEAVERVETAHGAWCAEGGLDPAIELDNLVTACRRAVARGAPEVAVPTLTLLATELKFRGPLPRLATLSQAVLDMPTLPTADRGPVLLLLNEALLISGRGADALRTAEQAAAELPADTRDGCLARIRLGAVLSASPRADEARAFLLSALDAATALADTDLQAAALNRLGQLAGRQSRLDEAETWCMKALDLLEGLGTPPDARHQAVLSTLGVNRMLAGRNEASLAAMQRLYDNGARHGLWIAPSSICGLGTVELVLGRLDDAQRHLEESLAETRRLGIVSTELFVLGNLGHVHLERGDYDAVDRVTVGLVERTRALGDRVQLAVVVGLQGLLEEARGRPEHARPHHEAALELHREAGYGFGMGYWLAGLARIEGPGGDWRPFADEAVEVAAPFSGVHGMARATRARLRLATGDLAGARADVEAADLDRVAGSVRLDVLLADVRVARAEGREAHAARRLVEARELAEAMGIGPGAKLARELAELAA